MGREIERKFLLASDDWRRGVSRSRVMRQGYLAGGDGRTSVRVRVADDEAWLNVKGGGLVASRPEYEYRIPLADALEMLASLCERPLVEKTRHWVAYAGLEWEIDEFHGDNAGLVVAELELDYEGQVFDKPDWAGREVTEHARYYNVNLVKHPYGRWDPSERNP